MLDKYLFSVLYLPLLKHKAQADKLRKEKNKLHWVYRVTLRLFSMGKFETIRIYENFISKFRRLTDNHCIHSSR